MTTTQVRLLTDLSQSIRQRARATASEGERLVLFGWIDRLAAVLGPKTPLAPPVATAADRARISPTGRRIT